MGETCGSLMRSAVPASTHASRTHRWYCCHVTLLSRDGVRVTCHGTSCVCSPAAHNPPHGHTYVAVVVGCLLGVGWVVAHELSQQSNGVCTHPLRSEYPTIASLQTTPRAASPVLTLLLGCDQNDRTRLHSSTCSVVVHLSAKVRFWLLRWLRQCRYAITDNYLRRCACSVRGGMARVSPPV